MLVKNMLSCLRLYLTIIATAILESIIKGSKKLRKAFKRRHLTSRAELTIHLRHAYDDEAYELDSESAEPQTPTAVSTIILDYEVFRHSVDISKLQLYS